MNAARSDTQSTDFCPDQNALLSARSMTKDYFRIRDFEYVQPLYDLAFLLEIEAIARSKEIPKYRTFSLWRAAYSLDGYGTTIDSWLEGGPDEGLDYLPTKRIRQYLEEIRNTGTLAELTSIRTVEFERCLRLRSVRGLGPGKIAASVGSRSFEEWFLKAGIVNVDRDRAHGAYEGTLSGPWQTAHIVPPLARLLARIEQLHGSAAQWEISCIKDAFRPVRGGILVCSSLESDLLWKALSKALESERTFTRSNSSEYIKHRLGWSFCFRTPTVGVKLVPLSELATSLDPLTSSSHGNVRSDLHLHTVWSDGNASVDAMATAVAASGLSHFAVTDHSRSSKLQGGLTPPLWLRQANALTLASPVCPVLHGIEVDILKDGTLDLPFSLLSRADIVVASVHSSWTDDPRINTDRLIRAIESGCIDVIAHPTSAIIGKPGVPDFYRAPADLHWEEVFEKCSQWRVALEFNCFPSRLDLPIELLERAISAGCAISLGSDAHARSHLINLRFGEAVLNVCNPPIVLNRLSLPELKLWIAESREARKKLPKRCASAIQEEFQYESQARRNKPIFTAQIQPPRPIPSGRRIVGIDLTAGDKATGIALLDGYHVETKSRATNQEILDFIKSEEPAIVSIDSPLGLPGGGDSIRADSGIMRVAEHDLASIGIPAYPALIDSMRNLTLRGIELKRAIESLPNAPTVIESYPGAAQDILCIPRKQKGLHHLRAGLRRLGLKGPGLETRFHDEMDAITAAVVGRYFEVGEFEPMGIPSEAQLLVPKLQPLEFEEDIVICLSGKTGAGKSVVARYLSVFYGFHWIRTRDVIRELLLEDIAAPVERRRFPMAIDPSNITERNLREFGAVILNRYQQVPLREKLTQMIRLKNTPLVVDSIRDTVDVDFRSIRRRPALIWYVDCSEALIRQRTTGRAKLGEKRISDGSLIDSKLTEVRDLAHVMISNYGTLEELRRLIDDSLFNVLRIEDGQH